MLSRKKNEKRLVEKNISKYLFLFLVKTLGEQLKKLRTLHRFPSIVLEEQCAANFVLLLAFRPITKYRASVNTA